MQASGHCKRPAVMQAIRRHASKQTLCKQAIFILAALYMGTTEAAYWRGKAALLGTTTTGTGLVWAMVAAAGWAAAMTTSSLFSSCMSWAALHTRHCERGCSAGAVRAAEAQADGAHGAVLGLGDPVARLDAAAVAERAEREAAAADHVEALVLELAGRVADGHASGGEEAAARAAYQGRK